MYVCLRGTGVCREGYVPGHRTMSRWAHMGFISATGPGSLQEQTACVLEDALVAPTSLTLPSKAYRWSTHRVPDCILGPQTGDPCLLLGLFSPHRGQRDLFLKSHPTQSLPYSDPSSGFRDFLVSVHKDPQGQALNPSQEVALCHALCDLSSPPLKLLLSDQELKCHLLQEAIPETRHSE